MGRKRTITDAAVLSAALDVVHEAGPDALTFGAVARRVGLAPATVVQRFGNKPALLQATLLHAWDRLDADTAGAAAKASIDPSGVVDLLVALTGQYDAHDFAEQLLVLREDLRDPVLRQRGQAWLATLTSEITRRLPDSGDPGRGAIVVAYWQGALAVWGFTRGAPARDFVRSGLEDLLARLTVPDRR